MPPASSTIADWYSVADRTAYMMMNMMRLHEERPCPDRPIHRVTEGNKTIYHIDLITTFRQSVTA